MNFVIAISFKVLYKNNKKTARWQLVFYRELFIHLTPAAIWQGLTLQYDYKE